MLDNRPRQIMQSIKRINITKTIIKHEQLLFTITTSVHILYQAIDSICELLITLIRLIMKSRMTCVNCVFFADKLAIG